MSKKFKIAQKIWQKIKMSKKFKIAQKSLKEGRSMTKSLQKPNKSSKISKKLSPITGGI